ncbi:VOC family protein [Serinicoccus kebangsaanensis]|uniref:VOC family protein n=1 Tax=Serinicoccus kebangsaanensis TaxID=2602069 RepID=UPI00178C2389|nr:VOC family protein [Serinicoccus kebangsaanensis]
MSEDHDHTTPLTTQAFQAHRGTEDWRGLGRGAFAWFEAGSHTAGAALVEEIVRLCGDHGAPLPDVDVREMGVLVRLSATGEGFTTATADLARAISAAARDLGLEPRPDVVQEVQLTVDTQHADEVMSFWETALGYERQGDEDAVDPGRRHPPLWFQDMDSSRPLRNRIHLDSVAAQPVSAAAVDDLEGRGATVAHHGFYACVADPEGNEVDMLPLPAASDQWGEPGTDDWRLVFSGVATYPTSWGEELVALVRAASRLADDAGLPLGIDVRPLRRDVDEPATGGSTAVVTLDTGKDRWEMEDGYLPLAQGAQREARALGLTADPESARFVQIGIDAADVAAVRTFWQEALGYRPDPRTDVTDIVDPRWLGPVLFFQPIDVAETERRAQRNRIHVDVFVPHDVAAARVEAAVAAGGTVVRDMAPFWWTLADPEGNELDISVTVGREEHWG